MKYVLSCLAVLVALLATYLIQEKRKISDDHLGLDDGQNETVETRNFDRALIFGTYSPDQPRVVFAQFRPILDYIEQELAAKTGLRYDVKIKISKSYEEGRQAILDGQVDFSRVGPASFILLEDRDPQIQILGAELKGGRRQFKGLIVVREDSSIKTLEDLRGCRFAFGDKSSTIGRYLAQSELIKRSIYQSDLREHKYLGRHDLVFKAVEIGDYDAGALKESTFNKLNRKHTLRPIHEFLNVTKPWIARKGLDPNIAAMLRDILVHVKEDGPLRALKASGIVQATSADFEVVRKSMLDSKKFEEPRK